jgi:hypothetical protein
MTKTLRVLLATPGCIVFCATSFAGGPVGIISVGRWQGAAYTNDKGVFSHCTAVATFDKGLALVVAQNADRTWIMGVADPSWQVRDREALSLVLIFDGQAKFEISATAGSKKIVGGVISAQAINAFRKSHQLAATANKQTLQFDLTAAGNVVPTIENCVNTMNAKGIAAAGDFSKSSVPNSKPPAAKTSAKSDDDATEAPQRGEVSGTGFVVSKSAQIVTNNHVVKDCVGDIHGNIVGQAPVKLRIVSADETNDLALLQGTKKIQRKRYRDDPRQCRELRRPGGCDRLSFARPADIRSYRDHGRHQFAGRPL